MARAARQRPKRLGYKLRQVRKTLSLTQEGLMRHLQGLGVRGLAKGRSRLMSPIDVSPALSFF